MKKFCWCKFSLQMANHVSGNFCFAWSRSTMSTDHTPVSSAERSIEQLLCCHFKHILCNHCLLLCNYLTIQTSCCLRSLTLNLCYHLVGTCDCCWIDYTSQLATGAGLGRLELVVKSHLQQSCMFFINHSLRPYFSFWRFKFLF